MADPRGKVSLIRADQVEAEQVEWLWPERIPFGAITVLGGDPGLGKSLLAVWLAAQLSRGELGEVGPASVLLSSAEDARAQVVVPRLQAAGAVMERVHFVEMERDGFRTQPLLPDDVPALAGKAKAERARLLVLDPLMAHLARGINSWKDQEIRRALLPLKDLAEESGAAVVVVAHLNKGQSSDPLQRLGGSIGLPAAARSVLLLGRDPDDPDGAEGERRVLAHVKTNLGARAASLALQIETIEAAAGAGGRIVPGGFSPHNGEDLLTVQQHGRGGAKRAGAVILLQEQLAAGPKAVRDLLEVADAQGISETTLNRAKDELGVRSTKEGFPGSWLWTLPDRGSEAEELRQA